MTYFDIESILAEEELVPCTTLFDFSHLGHLEESSSSSSSGTARASPTETQYLKEGTKVKMPLWAMEKWASLRYVKVHLPRHLNQKARERWEADPLAVDLRKHNPHFFRSANRVISILEQQHQKQSSTSSSIDDDAGLASLRRLLLQTYTGPRLTATLDWSWCCAAADDGSSSNSHYYTHTLTEMERTLFRAGASGTGAHLRWKCFGTRWFGQGQNGNGSRRRQATADAQLLRQETHVDLRDGPIDKRQRVK